MTQFRLHGVGQCCHAPGQFLAQHRAPGAVRVGGDPQGCTDADPYLAVRLSTVNRNVSAELWSPFVRAPLNSRLLTLKPVDEWLIFPPARPYVTSM